MSAEQLEALAVRCEQAAGDSLALNHEIALALRVQRDAFTASVDAAICLVPEGMVWSGHFDPRGSRACVLDQDGFNQHHTIAATPALAITAAALRARSA